MVKVNCNLDDDEEEESEDSDTEEKNNLFKKIIFTLSIRTVSPKQTM